MRYFFDVHDGKGLTDDEGLELPDLHAVRHEAIRTCGEIIKGCKPELASASEWRMTVTDAAGKEVLLLSFSVRDASASTQAAE
jgi:hypothetical protein